MPEMERCELCNEVYERHAFEDDICHNCAFAIFCETGDDDEADELDEVEQETK